MIEAYEKQIKETENLIDIADFLTEDQQYKKNILKYLSSPYDADIERIGKGIFTLGISKAEALDIEKWDAATSISIANREALCKLACVGARYLTTKNIDDRRINTLGLIKDKRNATPMAFDTKGDTIYLIGKIGDDSEYQINSKTLDILVKAIENGLVTSAHYISSDGLFLSLLECCAPNNLGFDITGDAEIEDKDFLFSTSQNIAIITVNDEQENDLVDYFFNNSIPITLLGHVTRGDLRLDELSFGHITSFLPE